MRKEEGRGREKDETRREVGKVEQDQVMNHGRRPSGQPVIQCNLCIRVYTV